MDKVQCLADTIEMDGRDILQQKGLTLLFVKAKRLGACASIYHEDGDRMVHFHMNGRQEADEGSL